MATLQKGWLRPRKPKPDKPKLTTNAERCKKYKDTFRSDPLQYEVLKLNQRKYTARWLAKITPEQKKVKREKDRLRQQKRRQKLKEKEQSVESTPKKHTPMKKQTRKSCKEQEKLLADRRERNKMSQQKRRANMSSQKKRREREKRMAYYYNKKQPKEMSEEKNRRTSRVCLSNLLRGVLSSVKRKRTKLALFKLDFVKKLLARKAEKPQDYFDVRYKRSAHKKSFVVEHFLLKAAVDYPGKRNSTTQHKVLTKSMVELYREFTKQHANYKISLTTFQRRRPNNVSLSSSRKFNQCLCEKCTNLMLVADVLNVYLPKETQEHNICEKMSSVDSIVKRTMCENVKKECMEIECTQCGIEQLVEAIGQKIVKHLSSNREWKRWEKTESLRKDLVVRTSSVQEIFKVFKEDVFAIAKHITVANWQRRKYQEFAENLPAGHGICTVDFSENYLCKYQDEVQSAHWSYRQLSIHPCVFFFRCNKENCRKVLTDYQVFMSDDLKHDAEFTKSVLDKCIDYAKSKSCTALHIYSDGCGAQYKSKTTFMHMTQLQEKHNEIKLFRHFFGSNHGKSLCDSCGGVVKNAATRAVASGEWVIQNAKQMLSFCNEKLVIQDDDNCFHARSTRQFFVLGDVIRKQEHLKRVVGTLGFHCLVPSRQKGALQARSLSCFCSVCLLGENGACLNKDFAGEWTNINVAQASTKRKCKSLRTDPRPILCDDDNVQNSFFADPTNVSVDHVNKAFIAGLFSGDEEDEAIVFVDSETITVLNEAEGVSVACQDNVVDESECEIGEMVLGVNTKSLSRQDFFAIVQERFLACSSYSELSSVVRTVSPLFNMYPLPTLVERTVLDVGYVDAVALKHVPSPYTNQKFPILTVADGNCVPRALSVLSFGNQNSHVEVRCRIVSELVSNPLDYLCLDKKLLKFISEQSLGTHTYSVEEKFQNEIMSVCKNGITMGLWQFMGAANVFNVNIVSVYPNIGSEYYQRALNCTLTPRGSEGDSLKHFYLLWSATREHENRMPGERWTANHVVPLLRLLRDTIVTTE